MCAYKILVQSSFGSILKCNDCDAYNLIFNNLAMTFNEQGFSQFKKNVAECYEINARCACHQNRRDIYFNTRLKGMQLLFSTKEVGALLTLMQDAEINEMGLMN